MVAIQVGLEQLTTELVSEVSHLSLVCLALRICQTSRDHGRHKVWCTPSNSFLHERLTERTCILWQPLHNGADGDDDNAARTSSRRLSAGEVFAQAVSAAPKRGCPAMACFLHVYGPQ